MAGGQGGFGPFGAQHPAFQQPGQGSLSQQPGQGGFGMPQQQAAFGGMPGFPAGPGPQAFGGMPDFDVSGSGGVQGFGGMQGFQSPQVGIHLFYIALFSSWGAAASSHMSTAMSAGQCFTCTNLHSCISRLQQQQCCHRFRSQGPFCRPWAGEAVRH